MLNVNPFLLLILGKLLFRLFFIGLMCVGAKTVKMVLFAQGLRIHFGV